MKFLSALLLTAFYIAALLIIYVVHAWYLPVNVVFYSATLDAVVATVIAALIMFLSRLGAILSHLEKVLLIVIWLLGGYAFAISVPTVLDRSLSFYILEKLEQRGGGIKQSRMADVFIHEYVPEARLVDVRLTEQVQSGTVVIEDGCVKLTEWGSRVARFSRWFRKTFMPKNRLLAGQYTDVLTEPLASSQKGKIGYECQ